jgi:hypothetical protein
MPAACSTLDRPFAPPLSEDDIQRAVFDHFKRRGAPGVLAFHPKNGGRHQRHRVSRGVNAGLGVVSGASDIIILAPTGFFALELKAEGKKPTEEQLLFLKRVRVAGGQAACIAGLDAALEWLEERGLLIGKAT